MSNFVTTRFSADQYPQKRKFTEHGAEANTRYVKRPNLNVQTGVRCEVRSVVVVVPGLTDQPILVNRTL